MIVYKLGLHTFTNILLISKGLYVIYNAMYITQVTFRYGYNSYNDHVPFLLPNC